MTTTALLLACLLGADDPPNWARESIWETAYESAGAGIIRSRVNIKGEAGTYTIGGNVAQLTGIRYTDGFRHRLGPTTPAIYGRWIFGRSTGYFVFREPDSAGYMDGYWGYTNNGNIGEIAGSWDGLLLVAPKPTERQKPIEVRPDPPRPVLVENERKDLTNLPQAEVFIGKDDSLVASWLKDGAKLLDSVGRLTVTKNVRVNYRDLQGRQQAREIPAGQPIGTCFLVSEGFAITAKHVLEGLSDRQAVEASFPAAKANRYHHFSVTGTPVLIDPDIAIVPVKPENESPWPEKFISISSGLDPNGKLRPLKYKEAVVIHFPGNGDGVQRISFRNKSEFTSESDSLYQYTSDTDAGSSGAPVFNMNWDLVAIHYGSYGNSNVGWKLDYAIRQIRQHFATQPDGNQTLEKLGVSK